jgi:hypothetical protein
VPIPTNSPDGSRSLRSPEDFADWRSEAERLLEHVRRVMSFAASSLLRAPIIECYADRQVEIRAYSQTAVSSGIRTIHHLGQNERYASGYGHQVTPPKSPVISLQSLPTLIADRFAGSSARSRRVGVCRSQEFLRKRSGTRSERAIVSFTAVSITRMPNLPTLTSGRMSR